MKLTSAEIDAVLPLVLHALADYPIVFLPTSATSQEQEAPGSLSPTWLFGNILPIFAHRQLLSAVPLATRALNHMIQLLAVYRLAELRHIFAELRDVVATLCVIEESPELMTVRFTELAFANFLIIYAHRIRRPQQPSPHLRAFIVTRMPSQITLMCNRIPEFITITNEGQLRALKAQICSLLAVSGMLLSYHRLLLSAPSQRPATQLFDSKRSCVVDSRQSDS